MIRLAEVIVEGGNEALSAAKPGVTCEEVEAVWQAVLRRNGYRKDSRVGYSIGIGYPPDWGERTASLRPGDTTELQLGMCFHFQSGMWLEEFWRCHFGTFCCNRRWWRATIRCPSRNSSSSASRKMVANIETQVKQKVRYLPRTAQLARSRKYLEGQ